MLTVSYAVVSHTFLFKLNTLLTIVANMDDPQQHLRPTERPSVMSTTYSSFFNTSWQDDEEDVGQCRALPSLPRNMMASGVVGLAVWVVLFVTTFCENGADKQSIGNRLGNRQKSGSFLWMAGVILMIAFYFRGKLLVQPLSQYPHRLPQIDKIKPLTPNNVWNFVYSLGIL